MRGDVRGISGPAHDTTSIQPTRRELRSFGLTVGGAFAALAGLALWRGREEPALVFGSIGVVLVVLALSAPSRLARVRRGWMAGAHAMSRITTPLFMSIVFLTVLTPLGLALRLAGRRPLARRRDASTFWVDRPPGERRSDLHRQF